MVQRSTLLDQNLTESYRILSNLTKTYRKNVETDSAL